MHSPVEIRQALSAAITAAGQGSARRWHEVSLPADLYESLIPELGEDEAQHGFAIGVPSSDPMPQGRGSLMVSTTLEVVWSRILGADRQMTDYDAALQDEVALVSIVLTLGGQGRNFTPVSIARKVTQGPASGLFIGRIRARVVHAYPLSM